MLTTTKSPEAQTMSAEMWRGAFAKPEIVWSAQAEPQALRSLLATFEPITLAQMPDSAVLLDRSELKYVLPSLLLPGLAELRDVYRILTVAGQPFSRYRTLYFDTDDLALYRRHHAGAPDRYKVRAREYVDSHAAFLEVKHRTGRRRTVKSRIPTKELITALTPQAADFLAEACPYAADDLTAALWNSYTRITLVSKLRAERVTLDLDLAFSRDRDYADFPGIVVAEVKFQGERHASEFARLMRAYRVRATSFSKYCMGVSVLFPDVKHNKFKAKQRLVARLAQGADNDPC
ncbi:MAG: polyphosphate polymerase domain-containing protein [Anaerolineae bacterium]|nr:polyphosphate polymerase domain-containing protein [Anaerolineae bacterium]